MVDATSALREYTVEGTTFSPIGLILTSDGKPAGAELQSDAINRLAEISAICNDSKIVYHNVSFSFVLCILVH